LALTICGTLLPDIEHLEKLRDSGKNETRARNNHLRAKRERLALRPFLARKTLSRKAGKKRDSSSLRRLRQAGSSK
jgi:hypothetical protein